MLELFTDNWNNPPVLNDGERMLRIITGNSLDELYAVVDGSMGDDEIEEEVRFAIRRRFGRVHGYAGYEDASHICEWFQSASDDADAEWEGEGWYAVRWSDGGSWTNEGPLWLDGRDELRDELYAAYQESTETHLPYSEYLGDGDD